MPPITFGRASTPNTRRRWSSSSAGGETPLLACGDGQTWWIFAPGGGGAGGPADEGGTVWPSPTSTHDVIALPRSINPDWGRAIRDAIKACR